MFEKKTVGIFVGLVGKVSPQSTNLFPFWDISSCFVLTCRIALVRRFPLEKLFCTCSRVATRSTEAPAEKRLALVFNSNTPRNESKPTNLRECHCLSVPFLRVLSSILMKYRTTMYSEAFSLGTHCFDIDARFMEVFIHTHERTVILLGERSSLLDWSTKTLFLGNYIFAAWKHFFFFLFFFSVT